MKRNIKLRKINRILIANRGEIVSRIIRTCKKMSIETVVVFSATDQKMPYLHEASASIRLEGLSLTDTYLNQDLIIKLAKEAKADAIHPGYGFLSENADFAQKCIDNQLVWIGPDANVMRQMADKTQSRKLAQSLNIPVIPAYAGNKTHLLNKLTNSDFPVILKAAAGGGGRGMRIVRSKKELSSQMDLAGAEALLSFGSNQLFVEKFLENTKHIEVQILGDNHGNIIHLFERECTIQRRFQKIIEESPSPSVSPETRKRITQSAVKLAKASGYNSAGTMEFLLNQDGEFFFIETNARIQVEHPVSEMVTGVDLVEEQIRIAQGLTLTKKQDDILLNGHALECRICAEDPSQNFIPSPGTIRYFQKPGSDNIRTDDALYGGAEISAIYDSLIAKLIIWEPTREKAINQSITALKDWAVIGIDTNLSYLSQVLNHPDFRSNNFFTSFIEKHHTSINNEVQKIRNNGQLETALAAYVLIETLSGHADSTQKTGNPWKDLGHWRQQGFSMIEIDSQVQYFEIKNYFKTGVQIIQNDSILDAHLVKMTNNQLCFTINGAEKKAFWIRHDSGTDLSVEGSTFKISKPGEGLVNQSSSLLRQNGSASVKILAPLPGRISRVLIRSGQTVDSGQTLAIIESMKTENQILSSCEGIVESISVEEGSQVKMKELLITIESV